MKLNGSIEDHFENKDLYDLFIEGERKRCAMTELMIELIPNELVHVNKEKDNGIKRMDACHHSSGADDSNIT